MKRRVAGLAWLVAACASPTPPPGGPTDFDPPEVVRVSPDSGQTNVTAEVIEFRFNEIVSERPAGGAGLEQSVRISPSDGNVVVRWRRDRITARPRNGWRPNTTYIITLQPGMSDLAGNVQDSAAVVVFSTGDVIPDTRVTGVVFDWTTAEPAIRALIEARPSDDSTLVYSTHTDSLGRFVLPYLATGSYRLLGLIDANNNGELDARERWDSVTVALQDSVQLEFYTYAQDTLPPRLITVTAEDSLTLRLAFDHPLAPAFDVSAAVALLASDSTPIPVERVARWKEFTAERAVREQEERDSTAAAMAAADTTGAGAAVRAQIAAADSARREAAEADSIAKAHHPRSARPALETDLVVFLRAPLTPLERHVLRATVTGVNGKSAESERPYTPPRPEVEPPPPDTSAVRPPSTR